MNAQEERNRLLMLKKVHEFWILGVLERSLHYGISIPIDMEEYSTAVDNQPWKQIVSLDATVNRYISRHVGILNTFQDSSGSLLILGNPGSGKTTIMLELCEQLIAGRQPDSTDPLPVVFNLSSWAEKREPLEKWLTEEMAQKYNVSKRIGKAWIKKSQLTLLFDGLDEVRSDFRTACVKAINSFRDEFASVPIVVCCRTDEYLSLGVKLRFSRAVALNPLAIDEVNNWLYEMEREYEGIRFAINTSKHWSELAQSPLMLNIMLNIYRNEPSSSFADNANATNRSDELYDKYIDGMFNRLARSQSQVYDRNKTISWLGWLAWQMQNQDTSIFLIERLQPRWLSRGALLHALVTMCICLIIALSLGQGFSVAIYYALAISLMLGVRTIRPIEHFKLPLKRMKVGTIIAVAAGLLTATIGWRVGGAQRAIIAGTTTAWSIWLTFIFLRGLRNLPPLEETSYPNQGIWASLRNSILASFVIGGINLAVVYLVIKLDTESQTNLPLGTLLFGIVQIGMFSGGYAAIQHGVLRFLLSMQGNTPLNYSRFLDYATELILLHRVGGGYIFSHRMLLEHLAKKYQQLRTKEELDTEETNSVKVSERINKINNHENYVPSNQIEVSVADAHQPVQTRKKVKIVPTLVITLFVNILLATGYTYLVWNTPSVEAINLPLTFGGSFVIFGIPLILLMFWGISVMEDDSQS